MPAVNENQNNHNDAASDSKKLRLVVSSGQTAEAVKKVLDDAEKHKNDDNYLESINQAHTKNNPLHNYRGYSVVGDIEPIQEIGECSTGKRPLWFIFPGTSSQCINAATELMHLDVFRNSINRCADVLRPKGIDLLYILTANDETVFDNFIHVEVAVVSMQIAFIDLLAHLGITPDGIIGISLGEFSAAYADGCATLEQTILAAYWVGHSILNSKVIVSTLSVVALSANEILSRLPNDVYFAANINKEQVMICGRPEPVAKFNEILKNEGIYTRDLDQTLPLGVHSELMAEPAAKLKKSLEQIYLNPKKRTSRWISTCFYDSELSLPEAQECSAAYFNHNVLKPMLTFEARQHIPNNSIYFEIAGSCVLHSCMNKLMDSESTYVPLNGPDYKNKFLASLKGIGKLYVSGAQPHVSKLKSFSS